MIEDGMYVSKATQNAIKIAKKIVPINITKPGESTNLSVNQRFLYSSFNSVSLFISIYF